MAHQLKRMIFLNLKISSYGNLLSEIYVSGEYY